MTRGWTIIWVGLYLNAGARAEDGVDYSKQIKPVFQSRCYSCHGVLKQKAGLRLDTAAFALKGGDNVAIKPGNPEESELLQRLSSSEESERMPPEGEPLKSAEIAAIREWIALGAKAPADEQPERDPRDHWAFKAPVRPKVPEPANKTWVNNPIDAFIAADLEKRALRPQGHAPKRVLLRRVFLDLVGLPPTREELENFVADDSEDAYEKVVNKLLDRPQYGERWGRHWMDIWRYSDWWGLGAEVRNSQKHIWHWRDWIIESLNADKGYDQMLKEMLAADELYPKDLDRLRASGFLARQYFKFNRTSWLDETVEHTSKSMLGLTFNCAKCHDHKYDPFSQVEYYKLRAIFEPYQIRTDAVPGEIDFEKDGLPRAFDCNLDIPTFVHIRGDDRNPDKSRPLEPGFPAFLSFGPTKIEPVDLPAEAYDPGLRPFVFEASLRAAELRIVQARSAVEAARKTVKEAESTQTPLTSETSKEQAATPAQTKSEEARLSLAIAEKALVTAEAQPDSLKARYAADVARHQQPAPEALSSLVSTAVRAERVAAAAKADEDLSRAELVLLKAATDKKAELRTKLEAARMAIDQPGAEFAGLTGSLKTLESNLETEESRRKPFPKSSTGRRTALAKWVTDPRNPLPARVAVNHIWSRHFGRALVPTLFDFGRKGTPPTHPELLDWLSVELVEHGWSMKHIHRLIVTSNAYQLSSSVLGADSQTVATDPENRFHWRANPIRIEAQVVRDSLLHIACELDLTQGGPSIPVNNETSRRRSLYFVHSHNEHQKFLSMFDDASVLECYRRADTVVPQQALALENSPLASSMAEKIAQRIQAGNSSLDDREFIRESFLRVLCVEPTEAEQDVMQSALARFSETGKNKPNSQAQARRNLVHALINHNDFVTVR